MGKPDAVRAALLPEIANVATRISHHIALKAAKYCTSSHHSRSTIALAFVALRANIVAIATR